MYIAYDILVIELIPKDGESQQEALANSSWPQSWHNSGIGKVGLCIVGLAFLAATIVQLEQFLTKSFHNTLKTVGYSQPSPLSARSQLLNVARIERDLTLYSC